jgi:hypothetical protein
MKGGVSAATPPTPAADEDQHSRSPAARVLPSGNAGVWEEGFVGAPGSSHRTFDLLRIGKWSVVRAVNRCLQWSVFRSISHNGLAVSPSQSPVTQTYYPTGETKKVCKCRPFSKRLKGFEPSTFCMAIRRWVCHGPTKCLQTNDFRQARPRAGVRELCGDTGGLDKERTMSDPWWERGLARRCRVRPGFDSPGARFLLLQEEKAPPNYPGLSL